ncbi:TetR/AcrR family transcriptional regulator [Clostridium hydrogenum]|uniref:TetR/AcrR family transcriptional regulator n=1 Tax=Clostridium hydrogenum TaxID=2855764 RepID=UPI001F42097F|nr:TetR/AcrR family transcriptional regulator [Clostridium hydrogenum]
MKETQRQIQKEQTRIKILNAAYEEFGKRGIMLTRTSDIAKKAGVSHGTVFAHFKTQEELITAVIEDFEAKMMKRTHELAENCFGVREVLSAHLQGIKEFETFYTRLVIEIRMLPKSSRTTFISLQSGLSFHLSKILNKEIEEHKIVDLPIYFLFNNWNGLINYYLVNGDLFAPGESVIERCGDELLDYFMKLIKDKPL